MIEAIKKLQRYHVTEHVDMFDSDGRCNGDITKYEIEPHGEWVRWAELNAVLTGVPLSEKGTFFRAVKR